MKSCNRKRQIRAISTSRWATYAVASAASALTCANSAEAEVHYSGPVRHAFQGQQSVSGASFPLDQDAKLQFFHFGSGQDPGLAVVEIDNVGIEWAMVAASNYVSNLTRGLALSNLRFYAKCDTSSFGSQCYAESIGFADGANGKFQAPGVGFIGFRFDRGAGIQYGWARIRTNGAPRYDFILVDYAWADPGESLQTGQKRSADQAEMVPKSGSLGLLAFGAQGLDTWRTQHIPKCN
jgi:hypothetical protein